MAGLLDLPPELLSNILELALPRHQISYRHALIHPVLSPLVLALLWQTLDLHSTPQVKAILASPGLLRYGARVRTLRFVPLDGDGGGRGGVGRGIGTAETISGEAATRLLRSLKEVWETEKEERGTEGRGIEVLDVASVDPLQPEVLEGEWLANLRTLTIGAAFLFPTTHRLPLTFSFRLTSLSLHNNHWQSLPAVLLSCFPKPCAPRLEVGETEGTLRHLDLSATYDVDGFDPFLAPVSSIPNGDECLETPPLTLLSFLRTLRLPPFETAAHLSFATSALSSCSASHLRYLELPPLASATNGSYDLLWASLAELFSAGGVSEVGLRGWATLSLVETAQAVLAAAGMDSPSVMVGSPEQGQGGLRKLKLKRLLAVEEVGKVRPGGAELLEQAEAHHVEVICGDRLEEEA